MKNQDILEERARLRAMSKAIWDEWQTYDKQYPVLPGAYKPPDYDYRQREFQARLCTVSDELRALPRTTGEKMRLAFTWFLVIAAVVVVAVLLL